MCTRENELHCRQCFKGGREREREREIYKKTRVAIFKRIQRTKKNEPSSFALSAAFSARNLSNSDMILKGFFDTI